MIIEVILKRKRSLPLFLFLVAAVGLSSSLEAQRGERDDWGSGRGDRGERSDRGRGDFDVEGYLKRIDSNQNGIIESGEMSGGTRRFLSRLGMDPESNLAIEEIVRIANGDSSGGNDSTDNGSSSRGSSSTNSATSTESQRTLIKLVPGFDPLPQPEPLPGFGGTITITTQEQVVEQFGEGIARQVDRALRRYDRDGNGILSSEELAQGEWGSPTPAESDLNKDGSLDRYELGQRYKAREEINNRRGEDSDQQENNDRGGRSRRGDRGSGDSGNERREEFNSESGSGGSGFAAGSAASSENERMRAYVDSLMKQYDLDKDGFLSQEELGKMRRKPANADSDNDGKVSASELANALSSGRTVSTGDSSTSGEGSRSVRRSSEERSSRGSSGGRIGDRDENKDGQIQMHEFAEEWDDEVYREFRALDKNGDGVITSAEMNGK